MRPPGRKSGEQKAARQGVRRARKAAGRRAAFLLFFLRANYEHIFALRTISAARGESVDGAAVFGVGGAAVRRRSRSARFAAGALGSAQLFGRGVLPRLFFSNGRPQNRVAARGLLPPRKGASGCAVFAAPLVRKTANKRSGATRFLSRRAIVSFQSANL